MHKHMFLPGDQGQANKELDCSGYCLHKALSYYTKGQFEDAAVYFENVIRSLRELERMKKAKLQQDQAMFILGQIKARQDQEELLSRLGSAL